MKEPLIHDIYTNRRRSILILVAPCANAQLFLQIKFKESPDNQTGWSSFKIKIHGKQSDIQLNLELHIRRVRFKGH